MPTHVHRPISHSWSTNNNLQIWLVVMFESTKPFSKLPSVVSSYFLFLGSGRGGEYSLAKWESEIASVDILSNVGYSIVFQPFFSSQHVPHLSAWASSIISLIVFDDVFAQRRLKRLIDYSGHGGARSGGREGGWYWTRLFQDRVGIVKMVARSTSCHNGMPADKLTFSLNYVQKNVSY